MRIHATAQQSHLVTMQDVAVITGRSYSWVRDRTIDGTFAYVLEGRRLYVTAHSLAAYLRRRPAPRAPRAPKLKLIIDNTK